jgi:hypothetical protein
MFRKFFLIMIVSMVVIFLMTFGAPKQKAYADAKDNLTEASVGILAGWSETLIYPAQQATEPGWKGKILLPVNIVIGGGKGAIREIAGAVDFVTFWKGDNLIGTYPGDDL